MQLKLSSTCSLRGTLEPYQHSYLADAYVDAISHKDGEKTTFATNLAFKHIGLHVRRGEKGYPRDDKVGQGSQIGD